MGKIYITLISLCIILFDCYSICAQCPTQQQVSVQTSNAQSFQDGKGELVFTINGAGTISKSQYRIRLWDYNLQRYVYDDNNPPFLNITEPELQNDQLSFTSLPAGIYALELYSKECEYVRYDVSDQPKTN